MSDGVLRACLFDFFFHRFRASSSWYSSSLLWCSCWLHVLFLLVVVASSSSLSLPLLAPVSVMPTARRHFIVHLPWSWWSGRLEEVAWHLRSFLKSWIYFCLVSVPPTWSVHNLIRFVAHDVRPSCQVAAAYCRATSSRPSSNTTSIISSEVKVSRTGLTPRGASWAGNHLCWCRHDLDWRNPSVVCGGLILDWG